MINRLGRALGIAFIVTTAAAPAFLHMSVSRASPVAAAAPVEVPANLETPQAEQTGASLFRQNCISCHGAPGVPATVQGLKPAPPNLLAAGRRNDPAQVFAKIKNGIPGTAMPAWGDQLPDQSIWALAAFLHHSRGILADEFHSLSDPKQDSGQVSR